MVGQMAISRSERIIAKRANAAVGAVLAMLLGGCGRGGNNPVDPVDGAADAPQGSATTSTGTGIFSGTGTVATTGRDTTIATDTITGTATVTAPATPTTTGRDTATDTNLITGTATETPTASVSASASRTDTVTRTTTVTATATPTAGVSASASATTTSSGNLTSIITGTTIITATTTQTASVRAVTSGTITYTAIITDPPPTVTRTATYICYPTGPTGVATGASTGTTSAFSTSGTTGTATAICAMWGSITVSRTDGMSFCPQAGRAASVMVRRGEDGSLTLSGAAYRTAPAGTTGCLYATTDPCWKQETFAETRLTPAQRGQLDSLVAAMPPGTCTSDGRTDPCILTTLSIDGVSDTDWGSGCRETSGPRTHLAGERAIVSFIDSLVPANLPVGVDASTGADMRMDSTPDW